MAAPAWPQPQKTLLASEQLRPDVADRRKTWIEERQPALANTLEKLVFIDETSLKTNLVKTTGWAPVGQRLIDHVPFGHWNTQTFIAGLGHDGLIAPWVLDGAMNRASFEAYVEKQLAPALKPGQIVVADNLSSHKSPRVLELLTAKGCEIIVLPPYSPDLNPIEMAFSKLKTMRREIDPPDQFLTLLIPQGCCQDIPSSLQTGRTRLRPLHKPRMLKLL
jgi:transposase